MEPATRSSTHPGRARLVFDRGTILITETSTVDLTRLPGVLWDPRVQALRAPAWRYRQLARELAQMGLDVEDDVSARGAPPGAWRGIELRPYQDAALHAWERSKRRGLVVLPTGSG